ncbi:protein kinase [Colletotrichum gloeosporioides Cg-14]|uniref:Protein kinase n=1 Tax=Colletotrichum gloeosporioides (strain Cg-14) TaxID=1237896 RepID=T0KJ95_COLGC|nr:protein kinase [Colletotrichum gloeosporioides Cg-14]
MRFHSSNSDATETWIFNNTRTYRPPEVEAPHGTIVSPKFDTWTLGCVYLEFITWHLLGSDAVSKASFESDGQMYESFTTARKSDDDRFAPCEDKFFYRRRKYWKNDVKVNASTKNKPSYRQRQYWNNDVKVKSSVKKWINCLRENPNASSAIKDVLDLVENHMLVISPVHRCAMRMVEKRLKSVLRKCTKNTKYSEPDLRGSTKTPMIAPRWTEKSSKYGSLDKVVNATFMSVDSQSNPDLEYINRKLGGGFQHPQSQSLHQLVEVAIGHLSPLRNNRSREDDNNHNNDDDNYNDDNINNSNNDDNDDYDDNNNDDDIKSVIPNGGHVNEAKLRRTMFPSSGWGA